MSLTRLCLTMCCAGIPCLYLFSGFLTLRSGAVGIAEAKITIHKWEESGCPGDPSGSGVALRPISIYYQNGYDIKYSQLADASWRWSEIRALNDAKNEYGTSCQTPFSLDVYHPQRTDTFHCSSLVWRIYIDNPHHSVSVDSNHTTYYDWLDARYPWWLAAYIITHVVAPDEIALDPDLDHYYEETIQNLS